MPNAIANVNAKGFLLSFINGVLNAKTLEFKEHSSFAVFNSSFAACKLFKRRFN